MRRYDRSHTFFHGEAQISRELVIQNWTPDALGGLF